MRDRIRSLVLRQRLLLGCASMAAALAMPQAARAQAFQGTPGTQGGSVT